MKKINTFGNALKAKFGVAIYKVPISISGFTCPNIDGTVARGGCTFCENDSFSPSLDKAIDLKRPTLNLFSKENPHLADQLKQLEIQFENITAQFQRKRAKDQKYLVYFQSFTNTYAPFETLKALYDKALSFDNVVGLSIGTRTDSITEETLAYLQELSKKHEIWVEYGIQSVYDETLERINRGNDTANVEEWVKKTKEYGLNVCGHIIFGLPDETQEMMLHTTQKAIEWNIDSVKFHPLYVVKRTALANEYNRGEFEPITEELYVNTLVKATQMLPDHINIQRVTAGINNDSLIAPEWTRHKEQQMKRIRLAMKRVGFSY
jgi:radical SAM protein (TIGR01212 family)